MYVFTFMAHRCFGVITVTRTPNKRFSDAAAFWCPACKPSTVSLKSETTPGIDILKKKKRTGE